MASEDEDQSDNSIEPLKPVIWMGSSRRDIRNFSEEVQNAMGFALYFAQKGDRHPLAKPLKGFGGAGVLEIVVDDRGATFRAIYAVKLAGAVYVLDVFQKKSKRGSKTPQRDLNRLNARLKAAVEHHQQWQLSEQNNDDRK